MRATVFIFALSAASAAEPAQRAGTITGVASYYGEEHRGRPMANGHPFDPNAMTAASWNWRLGTRVRVSHGSREVIVTITDRGPACRLRRQGRVIDLSRAAFERLAPIERGLIAVNIAPVDLPP